MNKFFIRFHLFFGVIFFGLGIIFILTRQYILSVFSVVVITIMVRDVMNESRREKIDKKYIEWKRGCGKKHYERVEFDEWFECGTEDFTGQIYHCPKCRVEKAKTYEDGDKL